MVIALLFLFSEPSWPPCFWLWADLLIIDFQLFLLSQILIWKGQIWPHLPSLSSSWESVGGLSWGVAGPESVRQKVPRLLLQRATPHRIRMSCSDPNFECRTLPRNVLPNPESLLKPSYIEKEAGPLAGTYSNVHKKRCSWQSWVREKWKMSHTPESLHQVFSEN